MQLSSSNDVRLSCCLFSLEKVVKGVPAPLLPVIASESGELSPLSPWSTFPHYFLLIFLLFLFSFPLLFPHLPRFSGSRFLTDNSAGFEALCAVSMGLR